MRAEPSRRISRIVLAIAMCLVLVSTAGAAETFDRMVIFGDSLTDPGNHFVAFGITSQPPYAPLPDFPYAIGGHHFSNGPTWAEQLTRALGMPTSGKPALHAPGVFTNYAVGRARARARRAPLRRRRSGFRPQGSTTTRGAPPRERGTIQRGA